MLEIIQHENKKIGTIDHEVLEIKSEFESVVLLLPDYLVDQEAEILIDKFEWLLACEGVEVDIK